MTSWFDIVNVRSTGRQMERGEEEGAFTSD
jgi:hypothetical protein